jgi:hypothetical protein
VVLTGLIIESSVAMWERGNAENANALRLGSSRDCVAAKVSQLSLFCVHSVEDFRPV